MTYLRIPLILLLSLGFSSCWFAKKKAASSLPPPPQPALLKPSPVISPSTDVVIPPASVPEPPVQTPAPVAEAPKAPEPEPEPVVKAPAPRRRKTVPKPALATPESVDATTLPPEPAPQLSEMLTPAQRRQYEAGFAQSTRSAKAALSKTSGRILTPEQTQTAERIQTFLDQAEKSRPGDLGTALQLARRADLLAQDLLKSLQ
jgi:hypothetical protein